MQFKHILFAFINSTITGHRREENGRMKKGNRMPKNIKVKWFSIKFGMGLRPECRIIIPFSDVHGICFYKNILQHYHKIEKSKAAKGRERERKTIKTASWPRQNIWRVLKTRPQPCVLALSGFATLMSCIFIARTPLTYLPTPPCTPLSMCRANILRKSCRKIDGKCDFGKRVCGCVWGVCCACVWVLIGLLQAAAKKKSERGKGKGKAKKKGGGFKGFS